MNKPKHSAPTIVVGFDFAEHSIRALDQALRLSASWPESKLIVVWAGVAALEENADSQQEAAAAPLERLSQMVDKRVLACKQAGTPVGSSALTVRVTGEAPADALRHTAYLEGADLIVVGCSDKNALEGLLLGSVTRELMKKAPCSVLVHRTREDAHVPKVDPPPRADQASTLGRRHTYHYQSRVGQPDTNMPLLIPMM